GGFLDDFSGGEFGAVGVEVVGEPAAQGAKLAVLDIGRDLWARLERGASAYPPAWAAVPLIMHQSPLAALWVGRQSAIGPDDLRLLGSIADIAATAIHRATLFEETQRRLERLVALRTIDLAINASQDMPIILDVLLVQVLSQLGVDAAALLLANPLTHSLDYAAGRVV